jgi:hypothetical protein
MNKETSPNEILEQLKQSLSKRAKVVVEHIQKHGIITTEELEKKYGYKHPPRAARDVREAGIPLESINVKSTDGRTIGAYKFGDLSQIKIEMTTCYFVHLVTERNPGLVRIVPIG